MDDDVPWLSADELDAWMAINELMEALPAAIETQLKRDAGLNRFEYMVLAGLSEAPGRVVPMSTLATFAAGSISRLSHAVDRLEKQGWVSRRPYPQDGRQTEIVLTDAGLEKVVSAAPGHVREVRRLVLDHLTPRQLRQVGEAATSVLDVVNPDIALLLKQFKQDRGA
jgi:DNA-binding MarR family transcriptional regulator